MKRILIMFYAVLNDLLLVVNRCTVCEASTRVITVHSQSVQLPDCPDGWEPLWRGFSFLMVRQHYCLASPSHPPPPLLCPPNSRNECYLLMDCVGQRTSAAICIWHVMLLYNFICKFSRSLLSPLIVF